MTQGLAVWLLPRAVADLGHSARCLQAWHGLGLGPILLGADLPLSQVLDAAAQSAVPVLLVDPALFPALAGVRPFLRWAERFGAVGLAADLCAAVEVRDVLGRQPDRGVPRGFLLAPQGAAAVGAALRGGPLDPPIGQPDARLLLTAAIASTAGGGRLIEAAVLLAEPEPPRGTASAAALAEVRRLTGMFAPGPADLAPALRRLWQREAQALRDETEQAARMSFRLPEPAAPPDAAQLHLAAQMVAQVASLGWRGGALPLARLAQRLHSADPLRLRRAEAHFLINPDPVQRQLQRGIAAGFLQRCANTRPGSDLDRPDDDGFAALCQQLAGGGAP